MLDGCDPTGLALKMARASLELGASQGFRAAKADCTSAASASIMGRTGMMPVHRLLYDEYKIDNRVVFKKTPIRGPALTVMAARLQDIQPHVLPVEIKSKI